MNLTPEQYKQLAEFAGHEAVVLPEAYRELDEEWPSVILVASGERYTPDTNDAQAFQLLRELLARVSRAMRYETMIDISRDFGDGESLNLAICHAVLALEGEG